MKELGSGIVYNTPAFVCVCVCVSVCVCVCLHASTEKDLSVWNSCNVREQINDVVLKTLLSLSSPCIATLERSTEGFICLEQLQCQGTNQRCCVEDVIISVKSLHCYFRKKHRAILTSHFILFKH